MLLPSGRVRVFVMVLGGERACDFGWTIHQRTPPEQAGAYLPWGDGDACFRVTNDLEMGGRRFSLSAHCSPHSAWGVPDAADVLISTGDGVTHAGIPVIHAAPGEDAFTTWKNALKVALSRVLGTAAVPAPAAPTHVELLRQGDAVLEGAQDPLAVLTRASPGVRLGYCAAFLDHQVRNGGFTQLIWNVVAAGRNPLVGAGADALRTLELDAAADLVDQALIRVGPFMDLLHRCLPLGLEGFAAFRDGAGLTALDASYFAAAGDVNARLAQFTTTAPEYFG